MNFLLIFCDFVTGLPLPKPDQTEEMLVEAMLKVLNLPGATVRTAVRLPVKSKVTISCATITHKK